ncbi:HTH-type transcriptional activator CmpR [Anatilimnocola aggregata]|uniref:HTH-type transcriptional activator CmpR n=1 Tax=Anatilimnocola aggregata TaxID=2528021 RepID=A0A517YND7_9BACT|nr:LysR family transcriptional regulator [Anatilimnocola aggregata]QDU31733.1 HTH-type transcriptional activator CmpR [Anatilimnocola aggregata]
MQLKSLKLFCDIVGRRSFSRAAAENGISQSGASQVVNTLEEELGVKLLDRTRRPFQLTPEGEVYYDGCRKMVQQYFALEEEVRTLHAEVAGRVSVASIYSIGLSHMNRFVQSFLRLHPKANVRVQYQHPHRVYELVETDQVDLGLVSFPRSTRAIKATLWREEPMVLVCAPSHSLAQKERVTLHDLHDQVMVAFESDLEIRAEIDRALSDANVEVRVSMEFDNTETIKRAVEIDAGISLLPEPTVDREVAAGALVVRPLAGTELKRPIGIIQRRGKELGQTAQRFRQLLLKHPASATLDGVLENAAHEIAALDQDDEQDDTDVATTDLSSARRSRGNEVAADESREATASLVAVASRPKVS